MHCEGPLTPAVISKVVCLLSCIHAYVKIEGIGFHDHKHQILLESTCKCNNPAASPPSHKLQRLRCKRSQILNRRRAATKLSFTATLNRRCRGEVLQSPSSPVKLKMPCLTGEDAPLVRLSLGRFSCFTDEALFGLVRFVLSRSGGVL